VHCYILLRVADNKTVSQHDSELEHTTVRIPNDLKVRAKVVAAQTPGGSLQQLVIEGLELRLAQVEKGPGRKP